MEKQYPVLTEIDNVGRKSYTYLCNDCGREVKGYHQNSVRGKVRCRMCYQMHQKIYSERKDDERLLDFLRWLKINKGIDLDDFETNILKEYKEDKIWQKK